MKNGPYILVKAPEDYPGKKYRDKYVYEHIYVWWKTTKVIPPDGYQVHHKNANKHDNRFENLEMIHRSTHLRLHKSIGCETLLICCWCQKPFKRDNRNYNYKKSKGQSRFYCSRKCQHENMKK